MIRVIDCAPFDQPLRYTEDMQIKRNQSTEYGNHSIAKILGLLITRWILVDGSDH